MDLRIDDARKHVQPPRVDGLTGTSRGKIPDRADFSVDDAYIAGGDAVVIDERAALDEKIESLGHAIGSLRTGPAALPNGLSENVEMSVSLLPDRAILFVSGDDAEGLLNRLFTNSVLAMPDGTARYAALLSPQGKLTIDFFVVKRPDGFWIDAPGSLAPELLKKLTMFKLRSKVAISMSSLGVAASWGGALMQGAGTGVPRSAARRARLQNRRALA